MTNVLFTNVRILDGTGAQPYRRRGAGAGQPHPARRPRHAVASPTAGATVIDGAGATLMPGMVEAHTHFSWNDAADASTPSSACRSRSTCSGRAEVAKRYLEAGWTSCVGAACAKPRLDVVIRNAINAGHDPRAALPRGQPGDHRARRPRRRDAAAPAVSRSSASASSSAAPRRCARRCACSSSTASTRSSSTSRATTSRRTRRPSTTWMSDEEVAIAVRRGAGCAASASPRTRARASRSSSACATASRSSTTRASPTRKRSTCWRRTRTSIFVAPGIGDPLRHAYDASAVGHHPREGDARWATSSSSDAARRVAEEDAQARHPRAARRRLRLRLDAALRTNAKDLEYFVKYLGFTPMEAIAVGHQLRRRRS